MCAQSQGSLCKELSSTSLKKLSSLTGEALYEKYVSTMVPWPVLRQTTVLQSPDLFLIAAAFGWTLDPSATPAGDAAGIFRRTRAFLRQVTISHRTRVTVSSQW